MQNPKFQNPHMPPTLHTLLQTATQRLAAASDSPRLDAELLLAEVLGTSRGRLLARLGEAPPADAAERLDALLLRRLDHEPIAYILGTWEFFSLEIITRAPVLVPRPETEHLVEAALAHLQGRTAPRVLDLCTGTGCVAIAIAKNHPGSQVDAVDLQPHAISLARENVARHNASVTVHDGDLFAALPPGSGPNHVIVSNPPYIADAEYADLSETIRKHEDPVALLSGHDGLDCVRRILADAPHWLAPGGLLALEIGDTQSEPLQVIAEQMGWREVRYIQDLAGHPRIFTAKRADKK